MQSYYLPQHEPERAIVVTRQESAANELVRTVSSRRRPFFIALATCLALAVVASLLMTPKYEARALLEVTHKPVGSLGMGDELGSDDSIDSYVSIRTQVEDLKSDALALNVIQQVGLEKTAEYQKPKWAFWDKSDAAEAKLPLQSAPKRRTAVLKRFHRNMEVKVLPGTRMIEIRYRDRDPNLAAEVDNAIVSCYLDQYFRTRYQANQQASEWLSTQLQDLRAKLEESQKNVVDFQKTAGILGTDEAHNVVTAKLADLNQKVTEAEASRIMHGAIYKVAQTHDPDLVLGLQARSGYGISDPYNTNVSMLQTLRARAATLRQERAAALTKYGAAYPRVVQLDQELQDVSTQTEEEMQRILGRAEAEYQASSEAERSLHEALDQQKQEANKLNNSAVQYTILKHEMEAQRSLYDELSRKLLESGAIAGIRASNIIPIDRALAPSQTASPNWPLNLAIGLFSGLLCGVISVVLHEVTDKTVSSPIDVEDLTGATALGIIPDLRCRSVAGGLLPSRARFSRPFAQTPALSAPKSAMAEMFRTIRSCLLLSRKEGPPKTILITSSLPGEGKSTVSVNLAIVLAQQGSRVLLIDGDMRKGTVHKILNLRQSPGLSELLTSTALDTQTVVQRSGAMNLSVIACGRVPSLPAELLGSERFHDELKHWEQTYDFVVIDAPPILAVTDPLVMSPKMESTVLVTRHAKTSKATLSRSIEMLNKIGTKPAGTILNGVNVDSPAYQQYFGYEFAGAYGRYYPEKVAQ